MLNDKLNGWLKCPGCSYMKKEQTSLITLEEILMGRAKFEDLPDDLKKNGEELVRRLNLFRQEFGKPMYVSSGLRLPSQNQAAGGAKRSAHLTLEACDFKDNGELFEFIKKDPKVLERCDLYMEDPQHTKSWIHLQIRKASKRIFLPYSDGRAPAAPERKID
jgi:hypothetical protein